MKRSNKKTKSNSRQLKKNIRITGTTLGWIDIDSVQNNYIVLKRGNAEEHVVGFKIEPPNIFLADDNEKWKWINSMRSILNKTTSKIYHCFVYSPINLDMELEPYYEMLDYEQDAERAEMLITEIQLWNDFAASNYELEFFVMMKGKESKQFAKEYSALARDFIKQGFVIKGLNSIDFNNLIAYTFNNEMINDFYFSRGIFVDKIIGRDQNPEYEIAREGE